MRPWNPYKNSVLGKAHYVTMKAKTPKTQFQRVYALAPLFWRPPGKGGEPKSHLKKTQNTLRSEGTQPQNTTFLKKSNKLDGSKLGQKKDKKVTKNASKKQSKNKNLSKPL